MKRTKYFIIAGSFFLFLLVALVWLGGIETKNKSNSEVLSEEAEHVKISMKSDRVAPSFPSHSRIITKSEEDALLRTVKISTVAELIENGSDIEGVGLDESFEIGPVFFDLLGLSSEERERLNDLSSKTLFELRDFESKNRKVIEESDQKLTYRIESDVTLVEELKDSFVTEVFQIAGNDGMVLLEPTVLSTFGKLMMDREVSLEFNQGSTKTGKGSFLKMKVTERYFDKKGIETGSKSRSRLVSEQRPAEAPERYSHLFQLEK